MRSLLSGATEPARHTVFCFLTFTPCITFVTSQPFTITSSRNSGLSAYSSTSNPAPSYSSTPNQALACPSTSNPAPAPHSDPAYTSDPNPALAYISAPSSDSTTRLPAASTPPSIL